MPTNHPARPVDDAQTMLRHNARLDRIHYLPITQLKSYGRKLRKRSATAAAALRASVEGFGIVLPILIDQHDVIIGGEGIVEAARAAGLKDVPTIRVEHLGDEEVRLLRIALNKLGEQSEWDKLELSAEFGELLTLEVDLAYEITGFETAEIDNLVHGPAAEEDDQDDDVPDLAGSAPITQLGDIWQLGQHRVLCGTSLEARAWSALMAGEQARMALVDAPFNVKIAGHVSGLGKNKHREFAEASGEMSEGQFIDFLTKAIAAQADVCVDGALLYQFMDWRHQWEMMSALRACQLGVLNMAVWVKRSGAMGSFYRSQHELCYIAKKGKAAHRNNVQLGRFGRNRTNCWFYSGANSFGSGRDQLLAMHPTSKNVSMLADAIRDATNRGELVIDGFLGSGSTLIAAERTSRRCFGIELDPLYVDTIVTRWERATGKQACLHPSGETFAAVSERRARADQPPEAPRYEARARVRACA